MPKDIQIESILLCDKDVARLLAFSASWVRGQRHRRKQDGIHALDIDPIYVGASPRYRRSDVLAWIERQRGAASVLPAEGD